MKIITLAILAFLVGCGEQPVKQKPLADVILTPAKDKVNIPKSLLVKCDKFQNLEQRAYTKKEVVAMSQKWLDIHETCRTNNGILIDVVEKAFTIKP